MSSWVIIALKKMLQYNVYPSAYRDECYINYFMRQNAAPTK